MGFKGNIVSANAIATSVSTASGIWKPSDHIQQNFAGTWPGSPFATYQFTYLVVAGGGGGGKPAGDFNAGGAGGGAGGLLAGTSTAYIGSSYTVSVGGGGPGGALGAAGTTGTNSSVVGTGVSTTSLGGGGGANGFPGGGTSAGRAGGSGGGGGKGAGAGGTGGAGHLAGWLGKPGPAPGAGGTPPPWRPGHCRPDGGAQLYLYRHRAAGDHHRGRDRFLAGGNPSGATGLPLDTPPRRGDSRPAAGIAGVVAHAPSL